MLCKSMFRKSTFRTSMLRNLPRVSVLILVAITNASCKSRTYNAAPSEAAAPGQVEKANGTLTSQFFEGMAAEPGSAARKNAGSILEAQLNKVYPEFKNDGKDYIDESQKLTKKIFGMTIEYMKAEKESALCPANKKIRLYRSFVNQAILHPLGQPKKAFHVFSDWSSAMGQELAEVISDPSRKGETMYENATKLKTSAIENLPWAEFLGKRLMAGAKRPDDFINMQWGNLASSHSVGSSGSPLVSASLLAEVSGGWGPAYIVADVCPERALPLESTFAFGEAEVYVPFFFFPEEIVRIEGQECKSANSAAAADKKCAKNAFTDTDPTNAITALMKSCYVNFGNIIEYQPYSGGRQIVQNRFQNTQEAMRNSLTKNNNFSEMRANFSKVESVCKASCETAQEVVDAQRERLNEPLFGTTDEDKKDELLQRSKFKTALDEYLVLMKKECPTVK